ncbi:hypothetical protein ACE7GA_10375 [Roseomonas sp. CCTCC AB2023176]|uniref:hypothetical protein n=1 Tax=Roseomonas sp. CCTCC AB2023176 TaxID=3342640 RepID=UPI0035E3B05A
MPDDRTSQPPSKTENWGFQEKTARPSSVGQHDPFHDKGNESGPGLNPERDYKPGQGDHEGSSDSMREAKPEMVAGAGVKPADDIEPGAERDAPPLSGMARE